MAFWNKKKKKKEEKPTPGVPYYKTPTPTPTKGYSGGATAPVIKLEPTKEADKRPAGKPYYKPTPKPTPKPEEDKGLTIKKILGVGGENVLGVPPEQLRAGYGPGITPAAAISASVHAHKLITTKAGAEKLIGIGTRTAVRNFIGRPVKSGIDKIFSIGNRNIITRFATNTKSTKLTGTFLGKAAGAIAIIGTYPFAGFIKEEALQTLGMGVFQASQNDNLEGMEMAIKEQEDVLNPTAWEKIINAVPFANVVKQLRDFYKAAQTKLEIDKQNLEIKRNEEPEEDKWQRIFDEQTARKEEERKADEEYYAGVQESLDRAREEQRAEDEIYWNNIREENLKRDEQKRKEDEEYWAAIRANVDDWNAGKSQLDFGIL